MMKAAQVQTYGEPDQVLTVSPSVPRPSLAEKPKGHVLIKVYACSLSPSDYRMISGDGDLVKKPPKDKWPYTPGGDISGVVEAVSPDVERFAVGDRVIATWDICGFGGIAEYSVVHERFVELMPPSVSWIEAAAMADSPVNSMLAVEDAELKSTDRLLVLGGSGAVGTHLIQLAKNYIGVAYLAATSTDETLVKSLGADRVINYRSQNWWEVPEFSQQPFDVIIDCAEGVSAWEKARQHGIIKSGKDGARFLAVVVNEWDIVIHTYWGLAKWFFPVVRRTLVSRIMPASPKYTMLFPAPRGDSSKRLFELYERRKFKIIIDSKSPFPLTTDGVRAAFNLMISRRAHGKVVIAIRDD